MAGIKGFDEGSASGMSIMMLDMLQHIGILERVDSLWKTKEGYKLRRPIMVGDAKSLENLVLLGCVRLKDAPCQSTSVL